ncbi:DUF1294 domain-containing protein [Salibacterium salarium]|uniref:DUF1294 domain-containing protein n=1 Tax=Salibacterium salarium TaxID=284579 RepID=A0A3R9PKS1_9BACI|nr:DUF1294 domain-containing protein [Salibacterium salarium]RSL32987.1 DUF1294 domain-containing protein [Salibacterium salarium]
MLPYIIGYAAIINVISWLSMGIDKRKARKQKHRISEKRLWVITLIGGSAGTLLSMYMFRHKTKHIQFVAGVPVLLAVHLTLVITVLVRIGG